MLISQLCRRMPFHAGLFGQMRQFPDRRLGPDAIAERVNFVSGVSRANEVTYGYARQGEKWNQHVFKRGVHGLFNMTIDAQSIALFVLDQCRQRAAGWQPFDITRVCRIRHRPAAFDCRSDGPFGEFRFDQFGIQLDASQQFEP